jgi:hypothetical protein
MNAKEVLQEELLKVFRINSEGGLERLFRGKYWRVVKNIANCNEYCQVQYKDKKYYYQRIIWVLVNGDIIDNSLELDHIDNDRLNNKIDNLRLVTNRQNQQNRIQQKLQKKVGYTFDKKVNKWKAQIFINKKVINLGLYTSDEEASKAYNIACKLIEQYVDNEQFRNLCRSILELNK